MTANTVVSFTSLRVPRRSQPTTQSSSGTLACQAVGLETRNVSWNRDNITSLWPICDLKNEGFGV